jgi:hypothetical protein
LWCGIEGHWLEVVVSDLAAYYMCGIFDYETWNVYDGDNWIMQITINHVDRSVSISSDPPIESQDGRPARQLYRSWARWLLEHERTPHPRRGTPPSGRAVSGGG